MAISIYSPTWAPAPAPMTTPGTGHRAGPDATNTPGDAADQGAAAGGGQHDDEALAQHFDDVVHDTLKIQVAEVAQDPVDRQPLG
ncbi:MAG: hypothetical protein WBA65_04835 [Rhodanobacter sp.]|jgi:hypothetical protein